MDKTGGYMGLRGRAILMVRFGQIECGEMITNRKRY